METCNANVAQKSASRSRELTSDFQVKWAYAARAYG
jgi:hypothetical protein